MLFVLLTRFSYAEKQLDWLKAYRQDLLEKQKKMEALNIDPELEFVSAHRHDRDQGS